MAIKLSTQKSKETLERLIRDKFHKINFELDYIYNEADALIETAQTYGLSELANELKELKG